MNNESAKSPFQMRDWRIARINYGNGFISIDKEALPRWELVFHHDTKYDNDNHCYVGTLHIEFSLSVTDEQRRMELSGDSYSLFTFDVDENPENETQMESLLKYNGLTFSIGMLRNYIVAQGDLLRIRVNMILPSINLKNVEYDQTIII